MHTCPECGNHDMRVRPVDGAAVHECGLCGARFGPRASVETLVLAEEAKARGVADGIWPLVRVLERLPGLAVRSSMAADPALAILPFVELGVTGQQGLGQLENLAKSLRLGQGELRLHWVVELEYQQRLAFVLKPRHGGGPVALGMARDAAIDVDVLRRQLERDIRLAWWRHADRAPSG